MVHWQLTTLDHLKFSGFGCPPPRHGLQLLFWFANECIIITHDDNQGFVIQLVAECQPDRGDYGFHPFANFEEILPVLRGRSKKKKKGAYFEVGNLNTQSYPAADTLPYYVKENWGLRGRHGNKNLDRVIISYDVRTKIVDMVYVTEHDAAVSGTFSHERTHTISPELIRTLQGTRLDVFLIQTGYYSNMAVGHGCDIVQAFRQQPSAQHIGSIRGHIRIHIRGSSVQSQQTDNFHPCNQASSEYSRQIAKANTGPLSYGEQVTDIRRGLMASNFTRRVGGLSWDSGFSTRERGPERGSEEDDEKWRKLAVVLGKALLAAGALYLGAKCFSWLSGGGGGKHLDSSSIWRTVPPIRREHVFKDIPIMMFYVF